MNMRNDTSYNLSPYFQHHPHFTSRASSMQHGSSPSSSSNGWVYSPEGSSPYYSPTTPLKHYTNDERGEGGKGLWGLDYSKASPLSHETPRNKNNEILCDDFELAESFYRMSVGDEFEDGGVGMRRRGLVERDPDGFGLAFAAHDVDINCALYESLRSTSSNMSDVEGFQSSHFGEECLGLGSPYAIADSNHMMQHQSSGLCGGPTGVRSQMGYMLEERKMLRDEWYNRNVDVENPFVARTYYDEKESVYSQLCGVDSNGGKGVMHPMSSQRLYSVAHDFPVMKQRSKGSPTRKCSVHLDGLSRGEESLVVQGKHVNHGAANKGCKASKGNKKNSSATMLVMRAEGKKSSRQEMDSYNGGSNGNECSPNTNESVKSLLSLGSLSDVEGYIYFLAKDQHGCRYLQRMLDEGTRQDVQLIFDRIIDHVHELVTDPFGNYLMQKFLDMCNEQQQMQLVLKVTEGAGQLARVSLDTHGTRVVQKLIETVENGKQVSLIISSLECGFLDLIKDPNGNHVIQRCLDCFSIKQNAFIFDAAARFCVEIATQRHGCCVLQKCISHATGRHREKLLTEVSRNGLLLSQDPFGNYVVQYVIELKIPYVMAGLITQLKGHFIILSMQKCSSHVVEKCLIHCEESRVKIVQEFLSVSHFEQLLQDPYANYVIQCALTYTKGPIHAALVEAVKPHTILRHSPYCKRIFTKDLMKK